MRVNLFLIPVLALAAGCGGGTGSSSLFQGTWDGTGTLTNASSHQVANGTVSMLVDSGGNVAGSDTVTLDGGQETESGSISSSGGVLALAENSTTASVG